MLERLFKFFLRDRPIDIGQTVNVPTIPEITEIVPMKHRPVYRSVTLANSILELLEACDVTKLTNDPFTRKAFVKFKVKGKSIEKTVDWLIELNHLVMEQSKNPQGIIYLDSFYRDFNYFLPTQVSLGQFLHQTKNEKVLTIYSGFELLKQHSLTLCENYLKLMDNPVTDSEITEYYDRYSTEFLESVYLTLEFLFTNGEEI